MTDVSRDIGRHDQAIVTLQQEVHLMREDLGEIKRILAETKGSIRMLVGVASMGGVVGAAIVKGVAFIKGGT